MLGISLRENERKKKNRDKRMGYALSLRKRAFLLVCFFVFIYMGFELRRYVCGIYNWREVLIVFYIYYTYAYTAAFVTNICPSSYYSERASSWNNDIDSLLKHDMLCFKRVEPMFFYFQHVCV